MTERWVLWRFRQDGKIKSDRMMKLITRGCIVSRFFLLSRVAISRGDNWMNLPQNDYQILRLTEHFYNAYPDPPYREVLKKNQRAYNCLLFQTHYDFFICIPYRTEIHHPYAFHFSKTKRSKAHKSEFVERFLELSLF